MFLFSVLSCFILNSLTFTCLYFTSCKSISSCLFCLLIIFHVPLGCLVFSFLLLFFFSVLLTIFSVLYFFFLASSLFCVTQLFSYFLSSCSQLPISICFPLFCCFCLSFLLLLYLPLNSIIILDPLYLILSLKYV